MTNIIDAIKKLIVKYLISYCYLPSEQTKISFYHPPCIVIVVAIYYYYYYYYYYSYHDFVVLLVHAIYFLYIYIYDIDNVFQKKNPVSIRMNTNRPQQQQHVFASIEWYREYTRHYHYSYFPYVLFGR